jgi:acetate kinase
MSRAFVCFNAGSSSLKFAVYVESGADLVLASRGEVDSIEQAPRLRAWGPDGAPLGERWMTGPAGYATVLAEVIEWVEHHIAPARLEAVGHRVVHGGNRQRGPALVTSALLAQLAGLSPLAPLHQPHALAAIGAMARLHPGLKQVACFDTAFHLDSPRISRMFALPHELASEELVRYGFHGLSYEHVAGRLAAIEPRATRDPGTGHGGRVVAAHLGSGASMCAMVDGVSVASTMGFSALDGLPMATRCGSIDAGLLLYLQQEKHIAPKSLERMLYHGAGLLGVSGISGDMRELLARPEPSARDAVDLFVYRIGRELGSLAAAAGGLDVLVFTAGIGEHAAEIRARVCEGAAWLGVRLDGAANAAGASRLHAPDSAVAVWMIPADEESVIARQTRTVLDTDAP